MFGLGIPEIAIIIVVLGIIFFGGKKIGDIARTAGKFTGEFKKGKMEIANELRSMHNEFSDANNGRQNKRV